MATRVRAKVEYKIRLIHSLDSDAYKDYKLPKVQLVIPRLDNLNDKLAEKSMVKSIKKPSKKPKKIKIIDLTQELRRSERRQKLNGLQPNLDKSIENDFGTQEKNKPCFKKRRCK